MRAWWPSLSPRSMVAGAVLFVLFVGGVEVSMVLREVCHDG
jgi:hypothetical protein